MVIGLIRWWSASATTSLPTLSSGWWCLRRQKLLAAHHSSESAWLILRSFSRAASSALPRTTASRRSRADTGPRFPSFGAWDCFGKIAVLLWFHCFVSRTEWLQSCRCAVCLFSCLHAPWRACPSQEFQQSQWNSRRLEASGGRFKLACLWPPALPWSGSLLHCFQLKVFGDWNNHPICRLARNHAQSRLGGFLRLWLSLAGNHPKITKAASAVFTRAGEIDPEGSW